jgi:plasmid stability protein
MQDKHKVTLYLPPDLHRQLKIRAAIDTQAMSTLAERALAFYLSHSDMVEEVEAVAHGRNHRVYACPECTTPVVLRQGNLMSIREQPSVLGSEQELSPSELMENVLVSEELVPC